MRMLQKGSQGEVEREKGREDETKMIEDTQRAINQMLEHA